VLERRGSFRDAQELYRADLGDPGALPPHGCRIFHVINLLLTREAGWEGK
jgi:hypothetical protein